MEKFWCRKKLAKLENHELFAKIFLANIYRYTKMYLAYALTITYLPNFSLPIPLTCMVRQNFPPPKFSHVWYLYLYLNTSKSTCILLKYFSQNNAMYLYLYFTTKCQSTCTLLKYFHMYCTPCLEQSGHRD